MPSTVADFGVRMNGGKIGKYQHTQEEFIRECVIPDMQLKASHRYDIAKTVVRSSVGESK